MDIYLLGFNYQTAPLEVRDKVAISRSQLKQYTAAAGGLAGVAGAVLLSTCNRTEYYLACNEKERLKSVLLEFIRDYSGLSLETLSRYSYERTNRQAVLHLFRVSAGLDSMVLGESQIMAQVGEAYEVACQQGTTNKVLNGLFQRAVQAARRARSETFIDRYPVSVGAAAVDLAAQVLGRLQGHTVLVLGAGDTSELVLKHLVANGVATVVVANRTYARARLLAAEYGGSAIRLDDFLKYLACADIVISCTAAPGYIIKPELLQPLLAERQGRPLIFIDIAVPRDIHPGVGMLPGVVVYHIDDLQQVVCKNLDERKREAIKAEQIIGEETDNFCQWLKTLSVAPVIKALQKKGQDLVTRELKRVLPKLASLSDKERKIIISLAGSLINKMLSTPIINLKAACQDEQVYGYCDALRYLFSLDDEQAAIKREEVF
ncbi:MAG: glutamyl-tRNA reductase [Clostridia bacterium]|nr:glutamyl-tRNA reductase [Clostridia bacterium]